MSNTTSAQLSAADRRKGCWGGRIPASRTLDEALRSCWHCGRQCSSSREASECELSHEGRRR